MLMARSPATPRLLTLTDSDPDTLFNLQRNLAANGVAVGGTAAAETETGTEKDTSSDQEAPEASEFEPSTEPVTILRLEWTDFEPFVLRDLGADLVVGADILYDPLSIPPLLNALECLLAPPAAVSTADEKKGMNDTETNTAAATTTDKVEIVLREITSSRRALLVTALRQPETLQKFVNEATARHFAPRDITDVLVPALEGQGFLGLRLEDDRSRLRVHLLSPPPARYRNGSALGKNSKTM